MEAGNEFDVLLRRALLDGVRADHEDILTADMAALPEPVYSMGYLQWQQKLRKAPFRRAVPQGRRILRAAACLLLVLGLSGILAWTNPTTRAWVEKYIFQHGEAVDQYEFRGQDGDPALLGTIVPGYLPEGFVETERDVAPLSADFIYQNEKEQVIYYSHILLSQGGAILFDNEHSTRSNITVNDMNGYLYTAISENYFNHLILFDEENGFVYYFFSTTSEKELVKMAESLGITGEN